ncbi:uncharacterized protein LOC131300857 [Rhododendron vialii]|uniref:uncharacterized protein LOC131300857 n=1 Tax=Rhododendron vialii TaxID=182163 RepID=UPI00265FECD3|nr:uncharacterized protein LOC131300857 [Rhododendron vialii]
MAKTRGTPRKDTSGTTLRTRDSKVDQMPSSKDKTHRRGDISWDVEGGTPPKTIMRLPFAELNFGNSTPNVRPSSRKHSKSGNGTGRVKIRMARPSRHGKSMG